MEIATVVKAKIIEIFGMLDPRRKNTSAQKELRASEAGSHRNEWLTRDRLRPQHPGK